MLGIFGDSYAVHSNFFGGWPCDLSKLLNCEFDSHAENGTSIWYSYKKFLQHYKKYSTIVFVYSNPHRWHTLPDYLTNFQWVISEDILSTVDLPIPSDAKQELIDLIKFHRLIFDEELNNFLYQKVFDDVNLICRENNIKLINLHPFISNAQDVKINLNKAHGSSIIGIYNVSAKEYDLFRIVPYITKLIENGDMRACHLSVDNNKVLANIINESMGVDKKLIRMVDDSRVTYNADHLVDMINRYNNENRQ